MWTGIYTVYKLGVQVKINDAIIMQYIIVHLNSLIYYTKINIKPVVGVLGCDIALGLNHILGHPPGHRSYTCIIIIISIQSHHQ